MACVGFPGGTVVKNPPANEGDTGLSPDPGRSHVLWATKPMCHNYWACALEPASYSPWAHVPQLLKPVHPRACTPQLVSPRAATTEARML